MRWLSIFLLSLGATAQTYHVEPAKIAQGQTLKVFGDKITKSVRLGDRTIPVFEQSAGDSLGLMPIGVLLKPGVYSLEWLDSQGKPVHTQSLTVADAHYATQNVVLSKALTQLRSTPDERKTVAAFLKDSSPLRYWAEPLHAPIPGCITSPFGVQRLHNGKPTGDFHAGLDQRGAMGSPIHAVTGGVVKIAQKFELRGGTVAVDHGQGLESIYLHMSEIAAKDGQQVKEGDVIGYVGSTGRSTGPHLHWTLYANGEPVSPLQWVSLAPCPRQIKRTKHKKRAPR